MPTGASQRSYPGVDRALKSAVCRVSSGCSRPRPSSPTLTRGAHECYETPVPEADATTRGGPRATFVTWTLAAAVGAANLALKLPALDRQSLWLDEALTVAIGLRPVDEIVARSAGNQNPPLYGILMHFWIAAFGTSETSIRLLPVLCSAFAAVGVFLLARRFFGLRAAIFAAILFTGANIHVQYAREARVYALVTLLAVASSYVFLALVERLQDGLPRELGQQEEHDPEGQCHPEDQAERGLYEACEEHASTDRG